MRCENAGRMSRESFRRLPRSGWFRLPRRTTILLEGGEPSPPMNTGPSRLRFASIGEALNPGCAVAEASAKSGRRRAVHL
jgi:hypothetical protein